MHSNFIAFILLLAGAACVHRAEAQWSGREDFEIAMTNILASEEIPHSQLTNTLCSLKSFSLSAEPEMLRHEAAFMYIWVGISRFGFNEAEKEEIVKPFWEMSATNFAIVNQNTNLLWFDCIEMAEYVLACVEDGKYQEGFTFGTNAISQFAESNVETNSIIWPQIRHDLKLDDYPPITSVRISTAMAAKKMGNHSAASNLVSQLHNIDRKLFWLDAGSIIEINEITESITLIEISTPSGTPP